MSKYTITIAAGNRREIWVSLAAALLGLLLSSSVPMGYRDVLVLAGCLLVALCCAINAALDLDAMSIPGMYFALIWLIVILVATAWVLIWAFGIDEFSNR